MPTTDEEPGGSEPSGHPAAPVVAPRPRGGSARAVVVAVLATLAVVMVLLGLALGALRPGLISLPGNPFQTEEIDRSSPPVLLRIQDLARFDAAEGYYELVVDLEQDTNNLPDWLMGERVLFIAHGSVDAYVDFSELNEESIDISEEGSTVTVTLPPPRLADPRLDLERSRVYSESRGLINRIEDVFVSDADSQQETLRKAEKDIAAAAEASDLVARAEENTRKMLEGLITGLGYELVEVDFEDAGARSTP